MRLHRFVAALLLGLPMATPIPVAAEDAPLAPEVQRRVAVVVLTNPLVVAVSPRLQRLLDNSCALDPTKEAEALRLAENEL